MSQDNTLAKHQKIRRNTTRQFTANSKELEKLLQDNLPAKYQMTRKNTTKQFTSKC